MTRRVVLPIALVAMFAGTAAAEDKAKVAVLGLEVTGNIDLEATNVAKDLTTALRTQVRNGTKFEIAPNSNRELLDEKVAHGCETEQVDCMSKIARKLEVGTLMYGRIERKLQNSTPGYKVELRLLDVSRRSARPVSLWIPASETHPGGLIVWAGKAYNEAAGIETAAPGPVMGFDSKPERRRGGSTAWKITAVSSGVAMLGLAATYVYAWRQVSATDGGDKCLTSMETGELTSDVPADLISKCKNGNRNEVLTYTTGPLALAAAGLAAYATYRGFIANNKQESSTQLSGKTKKRREFTVTPVVAPDGGGAVVRFDW